MKIIPAEKKDAEEIAALILTEFPYSKISQKSFLERLEKTEIHAFKLVENRKIAGYLELEKISAIEFRINALIVKPEFRKKGFGKMLLDFALDFLKKEKIKRIRLLVKQSNEYAKKIYNEAGFKFMGLFERKIDNETIEELELNIESGKEESPDYVG